MSFFLKPRVCVDQRFGPSVRSARRLIPHKCRASMCVAGERARNVAAVKVDWQFTTADARVKLKRLYPTVQLQ